MGEGVFKVLAGLFFMIAAVSMFQTCGTSGAPDRYNVNIESTQITSDAGKNLDLQAVGELVTRATDAADLEKRINDPNRGINNLDLDQNDQVDYVSVNEFGSGDARGFMLTAELEGGDAVEVATIDIEKLSDQTANVEIRGDERFYGANHYHHSRIGVGDVLLMSWLFSAHRPYISPWSYGSYPGYYQPYRTVSRTVYRNRVAPVRRSSSFSQTSRSTLSQSHKRSVASSKASLRRPLRSQRSFGSASRSRSGSRSGGFGRPGGARPSARSSGSSWFGGGYRSGK